MVKFHERDIDIIIYIFCLFLAPIPFASTYPWAWGFIGILTALSFALHTSKQTGAVSPTKDSSLKVIATLFGMLLVWGFIQTSSLPPLALHHPIWRDAADALSQKLSGAITLDVQRSIAAYTQISLYFALFWLAASFGLSEKFCRLILNTILFCAMVTSLYGLIVYISGNHWILWRLKVTYWDDLTGTFINKNAFASYCGIGLIIAVGLIAERLGDRRTAETGGLFAEVLALLQSPQWYLLAAVPVFIGTILFTHSRAGLFCTLFGIFVLGFCLSVSRLRGRKLVLFWGSSIALALFLLLTVGSVTSSRLASTDLAAEERLKVYPLAIKAFTDNILLGTGPGCFEQLFRFYRTSEISGTFNLAHNSYLEAAIDFGLIGFVLIMGIAVTIVVRVAKGVYRRRQSVIFPCLACACVAHVGLHSMADFSIQVPAVAMTLAAVLGVGYAQSTSSRLRRQPSPAIVS